MAAPRPNQIVWYWKDGEGSDRKPEPAIVMSVKEDGTANLWVFCQHGAQRLEENVAIRGDEDTQPLVRYATYKASK